RSQSSMLVPYTPLCRSNATQGERAIVDAPQYMICKIVAEENGVMFAESRVSHIIEETDSLYQKWLNYAMKFCFVVDAEEPFEDRSEEHTSELQSRETLV